MVLDLKALVFSLILEISYSGSEYLWSLHANKLGAVYERELAFAKETVSRQVKYLYYKVAIKAQNNPVMFLIMSLTPISNIHLPVTTF